MDAPKQYCSILLTVFFLSSLVNITNAAEAENIIFGGDDSFPPFEWKESGVAKGFNTEIASAVSDLIDAKASHRLEKWSETLSAFDDGDIDVLPMLQSPERETKYLFTSPFFFLEHQLYAATHQQGPFSISSLNGKRVAAEASYFAHEQLIKEHPGIEVVSVNDTASALKAVETGSAEYALLTKISAEQSIADYKFDVSAVGSPFWPTPYVFAVKKSRPDLAVRLEHGLEHLLASEKYHQIYARWEEKLEPDTHSYSVYLKRFTLLVIALSAILFIGYFWHASLRKALDARTKQLQQEVQNKKRAQSRLEYLSKHDAKTGMPHHFEALTQINKIIIDTKKACSTKELVILSLADSWDRTKNFGHEVQEEFINVFAKRFKQAGFDVYGYLGRGAFTAFADKGRFLTILDKLSEIILVREFAFFPEIRAGITLWPDNAQTASELSKQAEAAHAHSYLLKQPYCFYSSALEPSKEELQIITAFKNMHPNELYAMYQPQVDLKTGKIVGAEALVRWSSPELGEVPPFKFIPLLESSGLIGQITRYMINEAVKTASKMSYSEKEFRISINVSVLDFERLDLPTLFQSAMHSHNCEAKNLKIELTETSIAESTKKLLEELTQLETMGIDVSIDDFGTGYSSLSYLSSYPITEIKIDRSFIHDMLINQKHCAIVKSTIMMANQLKLSVVAEGAEDADTAKVLRSFGCHKLQGYVVSKPVREESLIDFLLENNDGWKP